MAQSVISLFEDLVHVAPPGEAPVLIDTACVVGGSIAGLLAARVLSDRARRVVVIESDGISAETESRPGVPQVQQAHVLLPAGQRWIERWIPGITKEAQDRGASFCGPDKTISAVNGRPQAPHGDDHLLAIGRPLLETLIRDRVTALPNVSVLRGQATGLHYRDDAVSAVRYVPATEEGQGDRHTAVLDADFTVDAMGRSSRLSNWLKQDGYHQPRLERLQAPINYATARFERSTKLADLEAGAVLELFPSPHPSTGVSVAAANAIEGSQWLVMLMGYGDSRPGRTIDEFRAACVELPSIFAEATAGTVTRDVVTYHQAESRRRHFAEVSRFPARLVSVGDAVASFNPIYGQGMSSAALHASCLASYLGGGPDLDTTAREFFRLQQVTVDAAWGMSAGGDRARLDALNGVEVPEEVRQQRWAMEQILAATVLDGEVARAFTNVSYMLRHPATLADPALLSKAVAAGEGAHDHVTETAIDRYISLADQAVHDESALAELLALFAPDATVQIGPEPIRGRAAIAAFYRAHFASFTDSRHYWNTTVLDDGTLQAEWAAAGRTADDRLMTAAGVEKARIDDDGLITDLSNVFTRSPG